MITSAPNPSNHTMKWLPVDPGSCVTGALHLSNLYRLDCLLIFYQFRVCPNEFSADTRWCRPGHNRYNDSFSPKIEHMGIDRPQVTLLTEYFHPEEASTAQLLTSLATGLTDQFDMSVLTALPNYHAKDRATTSPRYEMYRDVGIRRVRATRFDNDKLPLRLLNWLSFTMLALFQLFRSSQDDVRIVLSNPPTLPFAAWIAKRIQSVPYMYVIYDTYPEMPIQLGYLDKDGAIARIWHGVMRFVYRDADRIVVLGDSMAEHLQEKLADDPAFDSDKIVVVPNWEDPSFIQPMPKEENDFVDKHNMADQFTLLYSGNVGRFHEIETAINAIAELETRGRDDIQLVVIGEGAQKESLREYVKANGIKNVTFLPFQPIERLPETLTSGDASLVGIKPEMEGLCVSSKLYSSLAVGKPVLAIVGKDDEVARVVRTHDCGEWVQQGDYETAADILAMWADEEALTAQLGENARTCLEHEFSKQKAITTYRSTLQNMT